MGEEVWQDAQGQPEDCNPNVADTQYDDATDENDQGYHPGDPLQPEDIPGVGCKAELEDESKKSKGTFQDNNTACIFQKMMKVK